MASPLRGVNVDYIDNPTPAQMRQFATDRGPGNPNIGRPPPPGPGWMPPNGGPQAPTPGAANAAPAPSTNPFTRAGEATRQTITSAGQQAANSIENAGKVAGQYVKPAAMGVVRGGMRSFDVIPNLASWSDDNIPGTDRAKLITSDVLKGLATWGGGAAGGLFFGGATGGLGAIPGAIATGIGANQIADRITDSAFGTKDILRRAGYDPDRTIIDAGLDTINPNKTKAEVFGRGASTPAMRGPAVTDTGSPTDARLAAGSLRAQNPEGNPMFDSNPGYRPLPLGVTPSSGRGSGGQPLMYGEGQGYVGGAGGGRGMVNPPLATASARPDLSNVPNMPGARNGATGVAVEGAEGVRKFITADGKTLYSNVAGDNSSMFGKGGTVSAMGGDPQAVDRSLRAAAIYREIAEARGTAPGQQATNTEPVIIANGRGKSGKVDTGVGNLQSRAAEQAQQQQSELRRDATLRRGQDILADTTREGNQLQHSASVYGHNRQAATAAATAQRQQQQWDREFNQRVKEYEGKTEVERAAARNAAYESKTKQVASLLPPGADGKPDTERAARIMQTVNAQMTSRMQALEKHLQANPNDKQAMGEYQTIQRMGVDAMGPDYLGKLVAAEQAADVRREHAGKFAPWAGQDVATNLPISQLRKKPGVIFDDYEAFGPGGEPLGTLPAHAVDYEGGVFGIMGKPNNRFDALKTKREQERKQ